MGRTTVRDCAFLLQQLFVMCYLAMCQRSAPFCCMPLALGRYEAIAFMCFMQAMYQMLDECFVGLIWSVFNSSQSKEQTIQVGS